MTEHWWIYRATVTERRHAVRDLTKPTPQPETWRAWVWRLIAWPVWGWAADGER